jgi:hypothetical protein
MHRQQLATERQFGVRVGLGHLHIEQKPAFAEDIGHIDDARRFLVLSQKVLLLSEILSNRAGSWRATRSSVSVSIV